MKSVILKLGVLFLVFASQQSMAQKLEDVYIMELNPSENKVVVDYNGTIMEMMITSKTSYKKGKKKIKSSSIISGTNANVKCELTESGQRKVSEINVLSEVADMKNKVNGVFEYMDGNTAFIDGRKVVLRLGVIIKGNRKKTCGCKGMEYVSFKDPLLPKGSFVKVKGETDPNGVLHAKEAVVCKNDYSPEERELYEVIENSYNGEKMEALEAKGFDFTNTLYQGKIQIGNLSYQLVNDIKVQGYINLVGNRLIPDYLNEIPEGTPGKLNFRFYVIDDPVPNAFAFPNGMVFIHTGLLKIIDNESQLALVLGHEIAHVTYEHGKARYKKTKQLEVGGKVVGKVTDLMVINKWRKGKTSNIQRIKSSKLGSLSGNAFNKVRPSDLSNLYQKDKENQADRVGLLYAYQAGYDLRETPKFWKKMMDLAGDQSFISGLSKSAESMFLGNKMLESGNLLTDLGENGTSLLVNRLLETVFTSHPRAKDRYNHIKLLIDANYSKEDFDKALIGDEEYLKHLGMYK